MDRASVPSLGLDQFRSNLDRRPGSLRRAALIQLITSYRYSTSYPHSIGSSGGLRRKVRPREHLLHHAMRMEVHRAFDSVTLNDLRLAPPPRDPHQAAAIFAAQRDIRHAAPQHKKDRRSFSEKTRIELRSAQRMTAEVARAGSTELQPDIEV